MRSAGSLSTVEAALRYVRQYRDDYLARVKQADATAHAAAEKLAAELRDLSTRWPAGEPTEDATAALAKRLSTAPVDVIRLAKAFDWLDASPSIWWRHPLWEAARRRLSADRAAEIAKVERVRVRAELVRLGVADKLIESYMTQLNEVDTSLDFPPSITARAPEAGQDFTTRFILLAAAFDRGNVFLSHWGSSEELAKLDPARVDTLLRAFYGSEDDSLHVVARNAITEIPGTRFVDAVLDRMIDHPYSCWTLVKRGDDKQTERRLDELISLAEREYGTRGLPTFWGRMEQGECFHPAAVARAIALLEAPGDAEQGKRMAPALRAYLAAAMRDRQGDPPSELTPAAYRKWFADHPPRKE